MYLSTFRRCLISSVTINSESLPIQYLMLQSARQHWSANFQEPQEKASSWTDQGEKKKKKGQKREDRI